jgi:hypothetical protein
MAYEHLGVKRWPFPVVPEPSYCDFVADRKRLREEVESLLRTLSRQDASSIHLLWSWFGAGKTHTLYYLANQAALINRQGHHVLHSVYSEFPKSVRSFIDIYRTFAIRLSIDVIIDAYLEISTSADSDRFQRELLAASPDLVNALQVAATGKSADQITSMRWLRGEALPISQFRKVGIANKISSAEEASRILAALVRLLSLAALSQHRTTCRVIWLVDEFQRIERLAGRVREEVNTGLHSTFNACPSGLSIVFSFSGKPMDTLPSWFSPELRDRIGRAKVMVLPPMRTDEALEFVRDVLANLRSPEAHSVDPYFPFSEETAKFIIEDIQQNEEMKPRAIMQAFNAVLQEADPRIEAREMTVITPGFAKRVLAERVSLGEHEAAEGP